MEYPTLFKALDTLNVTNHNDTMGALIPIKTGLQRLRTMLRDEQLVNNEVKILDVT